MEYGKNARIKIKLKTGEEFEAEGDKAFINEQKNEFLTLIGKTNGDFAKMQKTEFARPKQFDSAPKEYKPDPEAYSVAQNFNIPKFLRQAQRKESLSDVNAQKEDTSFTNNAIVINALSVWQNVCRTEGGIVVIRRKFKALTPSSAALIIAAAAKILLKEPLYGALKLSKSMKLSGFMEGNDRLDRILSSELKQGTLSFEGTKRNRSYKISDEGFARAFVIAEKLI
ncbi:hypothetical protein Emin_0823 [Elusimicrobium minutum Pei191]|uniref:Uncharacterized protein n=1 Tax=Elusimicrobium minutum (strain Pei191) TaxID=445932 RepID=B2KCY2_ELUMP|nr:hypothetical protein [Elusimicrobium minutum]ACC98378.1 hypothetical protein Emin_0823 [Elusimicrobium minutum Pei191]